MTKYAPETALNFPLHIIVQERPDGRANIVYERPSSQIPGLDEDKELAKACYIVDARIEELIRYASGPFPEPQSS